VNGELGGDERNQPLVLADDLSNDGGFGGRCA